MLQKMEKKSSFVGPPFCGAPVRPNMLNMPKSASSDNIREQNTAGKNDAEICYGEVMHSRASAVVSI